MRRFVPILLILAIAAPNVSLAASWRHFSDRADGFSLQYPPGWRVASTNQPGARQVLLSYQGKQVYAVAIEIFALKPGTSPAKTVVSFTQFQRRLGNSQFGALHWAAATVGGKPAQAAVMRPPTEGGVSSAQAIYVVGRKSHVYEIMLASYGRGPVTRISDFPVIYRRILATWRFT